MCHSFCFINLSSSSSQAEKYSELRVLYVLAESCCLLCNTRRTLITCSMTVCHGGVSDSGVKELSVLFSTESPASGA